MRFISPKTDFAFKKIFGSNRSQKILISFLNAIVYEGKNTIKSLEIIDPYNPGSTSTLKDTYLDVRAVLDNGSTVIIEMQVLNVEAFEKRVIYNIAKAYANQLDMGEQYTRLRPFIALSIADFLLFKNSSQMINRFRLKEEKQLFNYRDELTLIFLELPKFNKELSELETLSDKWIYFLKAAPSLEMIPESLGAVPEIEEALTIASRANLSNQELEELHKQEVFIGDRKGEINLAKIEQNLKLISLILKQKFGRVNPVIMNKIEQLSLSELDRLIESILTLTTWEDVEEWLDD
ncbi:MAG: Rpn family recombination-promoting nuclease/putative transposase [Coleofasciculus sp. C1-SOL-03]|jgi:predicted transposase/invertase (TIGR01784 family)|uniref:Rpn family recombination-promoting nuclease/putative transposase n=1 Tax=Coleofasciculus sp. C1-SOL-03 TaxID=3069522 RepID=UPI0032F94DE2